MAPAQRLELALPRGVSEMASRLSLLLFDRSENPRDFVAFERG